MNCGASCLMYVHKQHGNKLSLKRSRTICKTTRRGTHVADLASAFETLGYQNVRVKQNLKWGELKRLVDSGADTVVSWISDLPAGNTAMPADGHYCVAKKLTKDRIVLYDPDVDGEIVLPKLFFLARFYDFEIDHAGKRTDFLGAAIIARYPKT